jgi:DNA processing protein
VGAGRPPRYGRHTAYAASCALAAAGVAVISGMAYGIDACAHAGALDAGLSAAVLACGLDRPHPRGNRHLFEALVRQGTVLSEYPPGTDARPYLFPARNRIVTGMSSAVIVVEAAKRSGSLVSARLALEQGRDVFAVPGNIDSATSVGTNGLLRDGCAPFLDVADVLDVLGVERTSGARAEARQTRIEDADAAAVLAVLEVQPSHLDRVVEACRLDGARVLELLTALELAGRVERSAGGFALRRDGRDLVP